MGRVDVLVMHAAAAGGLRHRAPAGKDGLEPRVSRNVLRHKALPSGIYLCHQVSDLKAIWQYRIGKVDLRPLLR